MNTPISPRRRLQLALATAGFLIAAIIVWNIALPRPAIAGTYVADLRGNSCRLEVRADGTYRHFYQGRLNDSGRWTQLPTPILQFVELPTPRTMPFSEAMPIHPLIHTYHFDATGHPEPDVKFYLDRGILKPSTLRRYNAPGEKRPQTLYFDPEFPGGITVTNGEPGPPTVTILKYFRPTTWFTRQWQNLQKVIKSASSAVRIRS